MRGSTTGCCGTPPLKTSAAVILGPYSFFMAASFTDALTPVSEKHILGEFSEAGVHDHQPSSAGAFVN